MFSAILCCFLLFRIIIVWAMKRLPAPLRALMDELTRLPGIGRRGAERIVQHLLQVPPERVHALATTLQTLRRDVRHCNVCGDWTDSDTCSICSDSQRANGQLCVVERPPDLWAFEESDAYRGRYHVLGGTLSPLAGVTAEVLSIDALERRIDGEGIREVILATNASVDGDATAHYLARRLAARGVQSSRIAQGVPLGGHLDYADPGTLRLALEGRRPIDH